MTTTPCPDCGEQSDDDRICRLCESEAAMYAALSQPEPVGELTDEEILRIVDTHVGGPTPSYPLDPSDWINFARALLARTSAPAAEQAEPVGALSRRLRPNVECAPWVIDEVKKIEAMVSAQPARELLTPAELDLCRQWFDAVQDLNAPYLTKPDYMLAEKLYRALEMRVPSGITAQAGETQS